MPYEELGEEGELGDGEVGRERSLSTLFADDADTCRSTQTVSSSQVDARVMRRLTNVSSLDHRDVVATVADAAHALLRMCANESSDVGLLRRRAPTSDDGRELRRQLDEVIAEVLDAELWRRAE